jgi:hypothetical protein
MSGCGVRLDGVDVSAEAVAKVPDENLRVPGRVRRCLGLRRTPGGQPEDGGEYLLGVSLTCEWPADQPVASARPRRVAEMPRLR